MKRRNSNYQNAHYKEIYQENAIHYSIFKNNEWTHSGVITQKNLEAAVHTVTESVLFDLIGDVEITIKPSHKIVNMGEISPEEVSELKNVAFIQCHTSLYMVFDKNHPNAMDFCLRYDSL